MDTYSPVSAMAPPPRASAKKRPRRWRPPKDALCQAEKRHADDGSVGARRSVGGAKRVVMRVGDVRGASRRARSRASAISLARTLFREAADIAPRERVVRVGARRARRLGRGRGGTASGIVAGGTTPAPTPRRGRRRCSFGSRREPGERGWRARAMRWRRGRPQAARGRARAPERHPASARGTRSGRSYRNEASSNAPWTPSNEARRVPRMMVPMTR